MAEYLIDHVQSARSDTAVRGIPLAVRSQAVRQSTDEDLQLACQKFEQLFLSEKSNSDPEACGVSFRTIHSFISNSRPKTYSGLKLKLELLKRCADRGWFENPYLSRLIESIWEDSNNLHVEVGDDR